MIKWCNLVNLHACELLLATSCTAVYHGGYAEISVAKLKFMELERKMQNPSGVKHL